jgi:hypothetical protein
MVSPGKLVSNAPRAGPSRRVPPRLRPFRKSKTRPVLSYDPGFFCWVKEFTSGLLVSHAAVIHAAAVDSLLRDAHLLAPPADVLGVALQVFSFCWFADDYLRGVSFPCRSPARLSFEKTDFKPGPVFSGQVKNSEHV